MRDLAMLAFMFVFVVLALRNVFASYLLWGWAGLMAVGTYVYTFMGGLPYAQIFALLTLGGLLVHRQQGRDAFSMNRTLVLMLLFLLQGWLVALLAYPGLERNWELFGNIAKTILFCAFMPMLLTERWRVHAMVAMLALAIGFHGLLDGLKFISSAGGHNARGIAKFGDNNQFALVLLMVMPLLVYLWSNTRSRPMRWVWIGVALANALAVVATHSRGGLVGMFVIAACVVMFGRRRLAGVLVVVVAAVVVVALAPDQWGARMETIQQAEEDQSFLGRVKAWQVSSAIALQHPAFGGGFRAIQSEEVWDKFVDAPHLLGFMEVPFATRVGIAAHSIWFEVLGDMGFLGLALYVMLIVNAFLTWRSVRALARSDLQRFHWAEELANMIAIALLVYVISGSLLSAAYFESPYILMMLLESVRQLLLRQVARAGR
jgi:probable O-glycosylation ligase (exosortase A-associated)